MKLEELPRVEIVQLPTPLEEMPRLSETLGVRMLVKRDDRIGLAGGGNKGRKLEYLVAEALEQGADTLITTGAIQSNHARQTAAAAAKFGMEADLVLVGSEPPIRDGNLLLDDLLGARVHWVAPESAATADQEMGRVAEELRQKGHKPYIMPRGGSNAVGATGYVQAGLEAMGQLTERGLEADRMVVATGSGGTHAGLLVGARMAGFGSQILGIAVSRPKNQLIAKLKGLVKAIVEHLEVTLSFEDRDFVVYDDYLGAGYGRPAALEREAIRLVARKEGIILDPVYTGRTMGGVMDLIRRGVVAKGETLLFWHTGGFPGIFVFKEALL